MVALALPPSIRVSIHAPTRGATQFNEFANSGASVSIHAPTRGATFDAPQALNHSFVVSIHAPTRGATHWLPYFQWQGK